MLLLVKHSAPQVVTGISPELWVLTKDGQQRCKPLADRIAPYRPVAIYTSEEVKAIETGKLLAGHLAIPSSSAANLHEHDRSNVPHMRTGEFISRMELAFRKPADVVLGRESVQAAADRLTAAIQPLLAKHPGQTIVVVTHGTILAQWLASRGTESAFELWRKMGLPSMAVLDQPSLNVVERIDTIQ